MHKSLKLAALAAFAVLCPAQTDWLTQVRNKPFLDAREYAFTRTNGKGASGDLSVAGAVTVTVTPGPKGVAGTNANHYAYISGGVGVAETVLFTGGTCDGTGQASCTLEFTTTQAHTGAWTITSATGGWREALIVAGANAVVDGADAQTTIYAPIVVDQDGVTLRCSGCKIAASTIGGPMIEINGSEQTLDGLWIDQANNNPAGDISVELGANAQHIHIRNCKFTGAQTQAILSHVDGTRDVLIEGNLFSQVRYGVILSWAATVPSSGWNQQDWRIAHNRFEGLLGDAVCFNFALMAEGKTYYEGGKHFVVAHNYISGGTGTNAAEGFGVSLAGASNVVIEGNQIVNARWHGIHLEDKSADVLIRGNIINGTTGDGVAWPTDCAGVWATNSRGITIEGNDISDTRDSGIQMNFDADPALQTSAYFIAHNRIQRAGGNGIHLSGGRVATLNAQVHGNYVYGSSGSAFYLANNPANIDLLDNIFLNSARYGIEAQPSPGGRWANNRLEGHTLGEMLHLGDVEPIVYSPAPVKSVGTVAAGVTPWQNVANVGQLAAGTLTVTAWGYDTDQMTRSWSLVWDGTTLKDALGADPPAALGTDAVGAAITGIEIRVSGGVLQARATAGFSGFDVYFNARFDGTISRR